MKVEQKVLFLLSLLTVPMILTVNWIHWTSGICGLEKDITRDKDISSTVIIKRPWYFNNGTEWPKKGKTKPKLYPEDDEGDRIVEQLMYIPQDYEGDETPPKTILIFSGFKYWFEIPGAENYTFSDCPVNRCSLTGNRSFASTADALIFIDKFIRPKTLRPPNQIWILYHRESPKRTKLLRRPNVFNWTLTYRRDSTIPELYSYKWVYYNERIKHQPQSTNYAANKKKKVAWFVSNCRPHNERMVYTKELSKYIPVDIYGKCGTLSCSRTKACDSMLSTDYKFYLAFENANCKDYITEKIMRGLGESVLPIVMGARPEDYKKVAPEGSYIHVDDFATPKDLADYLHKLDGDEELYNSYFSWRGTGEFVNMRFWCRLCAMLHGPIRSGFYEDINEWWRGEGVCVSSSWGEP